MDHSLLIQPLAVAVFREEAESRPPAGRRERSVMLLVTGFRPQLYMREREADGAEAYENRKRQRRQREDRVETFGDE